MRRSTWRWSNPANESSADLLTQYAGPCAPTLTVRVISSADGYENPGVKVNLVDLTPPHIVTRDEWPLLWRS